MKFHEALRKAVRQFGINVLQEHRLMSVLADYKAFDDYPAVKEVMKAISTEGHGKELCRLAMDGSDEECLRYAEDLKKSLVRNSSFREEFAEYAAESLLFALGLRSSVQEPSDHGFEAVRSNNVPERAGGDTRSSNEASAKEEAAQEQKKDSVSAKPVQDDPESLFQLGEKHYHGNGVAQDYKEAAYFYRQSAEKGHARAAEQLGYMYRDGLGVERSWSEAQKWFSKWHDDAPRVDLGSAGAKHNTDRIDAAAIEFFLRGEDYYYGRGVGQDYKEAAYCYRQAAEKGYARAAEQLGYMYRDGLGVERSWSEAQKWFQKGRTD
ncbi:MAG: tetratricopeptide repeat protein [Succinivibrionaceae bacterium]|nr:tetratricopeptide repeat protein [Succinivibrionaceae bacterium]